MINGAMTSLCMAGLMEGKKLHGKVLLNAVTTGEAKESFSPEGEIKFSVPELLHPLKATSNIIGTH